MSRVLVTGGGGFVGSHLVERLRTEGHDVVAARRRDHDLTTMEDTRRLFDEAAPETVRLGRLAFAALWQAAIPVPAHRLLGSTSARPSGAYEQPLDPSVDPAALRPRLPVWPLLRH